MGDIFAEATVRVTPSLTRFVTDLDTELKKAMAKVKPPVIRVRPGLTLDFVGDLRRQVNAAILQAQKGIKPIRISAIVSTPTGKPITVTGAGAPVGGGAAGGGGVRTVSETTRLDQARKALSKTSERLSGIENKLLLESTELGRAKARLRETLLAEATAERAVATSAETTDAALQKQALALQKDIQLKIKDAAASVRLAETNKNIADAGRIVSKRQAQRTSNLEAGAFEARTLGVSARAQVVANSAVEKSIEGTKNLAAERALLANRSETLAQANDAVKASLRSGNIALIDAASNTRTLAKQEVEASKARVRAAREEASATSKNIRSREQLSRGGQASLLSLAGIRGATLAASRSFLVGAAAITVFAKAVKSFADLNRNLDVFQATASATANEMERVREAATKLGADLTLPGVSAGDAAGAMVELAKAGLSVEDSIAAARGVLELATAAAIDNAAATQLVANALNAFQLEGRDAIVVADTFANAANAAQGSIADIGTAFQQAAAAGRQVGLSFQDTSVFLTILAKNGLRGSDAGTSLRTALIRLVNPSKEAAAKFKELGIQVRDATGNLRPDVFLQIADATSRLSPAARDAAIALIGGQDAFRAVTILGRQSVASFIALRRSLREEGTAAQLAEARTRGLHGAMDGLTSVLETVGTRLGGAVGPGLATFVRSTSSGINALSESNDVATTLNQTLIALGQTFRGLGDAVQFVSPLVLGLSRGLLGITNAIGVGEILAGVAAYKILGGAASRLGTLFGITSKGVFGFGVQQRAAITTTAGLRKALIGAASSFNVYLLAAAAVTAGLVFLITRETAAERATRHLTESTKELGKALSDVAQAQSQQVFTSRSVNQAVANVDAAKQAAATAKATLENSKAAKGSAEYRRQQLALAIAIDNVAIAEQQLSDASRDAEEARSAAIAAGLRRDDARKKERTSIAETIAASIKAAQFATHGGKTTKDGIDREVFARQVLIDKLNEQGQASIRSEEAGERAAGKRLLALAKLTRATNELPSQHVIDVLINSVSVGAALEKLKKDFKKNGDLAGQSAVESILLQFGIIPDKLKDFLDMRTTYDDIFRKPADKAGEDSAKAFLASFERAFKAGQGRLAGLDFQLDLATIASDAVDAGLPILKQKLATIRKAIADNEAAIAKLGLTPTRRKRRRTLTAQEAQIVEQIRGINEQVASEAKAATDKAAQDSADATQAFLDRFQTRRQQLENKITAAGLSPGLADDIAANKVLIQFFKKRIELIKDRIKRMKLHGDALKAAKAAIAAFGQDIFNTRRQIIELVKQQAEARQALIIERLDLRIQIAESRGDIKAQIRAHRAKLAEITRELVLARRQYGKNSIEWLRLRAAQAAEIAEIKELEGQTKQRNNALQRMQFTFLQTQSGFAANLLGNLIPGLAGGGTVGGTTAGGTTGGSRIGGFGQPGGPQPGGGVIPGMIVTRPKSPADDLRKTTVTVTGGPTLGGQSVTNQRLQLIINLLAKIYSGTGHPEAKHRQSRNLREMDIDDKK